MFEHLEHPYLAQRAVVDDYQEDAIVCAEQKRRAYAQRTGTTLTTSIMNHEPELTMFLPPGPVCRNMLAKTIKVPLNNTEERNKASGGHTVSDCITPRSSFYIMKSFSVTLVFSSSSVNSNHILTSLLRIVTDFNPTDCDCYLSTSQLLISPAPLLCNDRNQEALSIVSYQPD